MILRYQLAFPGASVFQAVKWEQMWQSEGRIVPLLPMGKAIPEKIPLESSSTLAPLLPLLLQEAQTAAAAPESES